MSFVLSCFFFLAGCAGLGHQVVLPSAAHRPELHLIPDVPPVAQESYQCGPASLESVFHRWGENRSAHAIAPELMLPGERGVLNFMLARYARDRGYWTEVHHAGEGDLKSWIRRDIPPIVMLRVGPRLVPDYHFVVLRGFDDKEKIYYANIGKGETYAIRYRDFHERWMDAHAWVLIVCPPERVDWDLSAENASELALLLEGRGKWALAENWYGQVLQKEPGNAMIRYNLGNLYLKTERWDEAEALFKDLASSRPDWASVHNNLAWIYLEKGLPGEAIGVIERAFDEGAERRPDILDTLAQAHCASGLPLEAKRLFEEALEKISPSEKELLRLIQDHERSCAENVRT